MRWLLVATRNPGKLAELSDFAAALGRTAVTLEQAGVAATDAEEHLEVHPSFEANAVAKARYYHRASGGLPTVADDSGLEVDALGGGPGVRSRRWAGATGSELDVARANNRALLERLAGRADRTARFTCVVAYVDASLELLSRGVVRGHVAPAPRGDAGFGYDPLFVPDEMDGRTFGECSAEEKARVSHRARAFAAIRAALTGLSPDRTLPHDGA